MDLSEEKLRAVEREADEGGIGALEALSEAAEHRFPGYGAHINHVRRLTEIILSELARRCPEYGLDGETIYLYCRASEFHDIGKIMLPVSILNKNGPLTEDEKNIVRTHTAQGAAIIDEIRVPGQEKLLSFCREAALHHHERYDGKGYPGDLGGDSIPVGLQVISLADVYDALRSPRVYKPAQSHCQTVDQIRSSFKGAFRPELLYFLDLCALDIKGVYGENGSR